MIFLGAATFVVEDFKPDAPDPDKEMKQQCPLCNELRKLKEMRDHVGHHILLHSRGGEDARLLKTVSHPLLWQIPKTNSHKRSVTLPVDSVVVIYAEPPSRQLEPNDRSNRTAGSVAHSSMARLRSRRKTPRAPTSRSSVLTAQRRFGSTTQLTTSS